MLFTGSRGRRVRGRRVIVRSRGRREIIVIIFLMRNGFVVVLTHIRSVIDIVLGLLTVAGMGLLTVAGIHLAFIVGMGPSEIRMSQSLRNCHKT